MPGGALVPMLYPTIHIDIYILLGSGDQKLRNMNLLVCAIDMSC